MYTWTHGTALTPCFPNLWTTTWNLCPDERRLNYLHSFPATDPQPQKHSLCHLSPPRGYTICLSNFAWRFWCSSCNHVVRCSKTSFSVQPSVSMYRSAHSHFNVKLLRLTSLKRWCILNQSSTLAFDRRHDMSLGTILGYPMKDMASTAMLWCWRPLHS
jgi:hypothetical protein